MSSDNDLPSGAGEIIALSEKENFRRRPHHELTLGYVYFISRGDAIKIGFSSKPERRMAALQNQQTELLELLATAPGTLRHERSLHEKFEHLLIGAEWFRPEQELLDFVEHVRRTRQTPFSRADEMKRTRHQLNLIARQHKGNVAVTNRVKVLLGLLSRLDQPDLEPEATARIRRDIVISTDGVAQVVRDGGEYIHENHSWKAREARGVV